MEMTHQLVCMWSDGVQTVSLHSSQALAERKISNMNYRWKKNRLPEKPEWVIREKNADMGDGRVWNKIVNNGHRIGDKINE